MIEKALILAAEMHKNQKSDNGEAYILHPLRVLNLLQLDKICKFYREVRINFGEEVEEALRVITHAKYQPYLVYIDTVKTNTIARKVKLADVKDNYNRTHSGDMRRVYKYSIAYKILINEDCNASIK